MSLPAWFRPFCDDLRVTGVLAQSARRVGAPYSSVTQLRATNADAAAEITDALEEATDALEAEARRRALEGVNEPVVYQGQLTPVWEYDPDGSISLDLVTGKPIQARNPDGSPKWLTINKRSDALLMFQLKGLRRRVYGDKQEITGADGGALALVDDTKKAARVAALIALAQTRKDGADLT